MTARFGLIQPITGTIVGVNSEGRRLTLIVAAKEVVKLLRPGHTALKVQLNPLHLVDICVFA